jgi:serine/threonine protein phosphatase PrpC
MFFKWRAYYLWNGNPVAYCHDVQNNDIVIVASDGVLDNMYTKDLVQLLKKKTLRNLQTKE